MRAIALLVLGLAAGMIGAMLQTYVVRVGSTTVPVGAVAVLIVVVLLARASAWWVERRWGAVAFSVGWLGATLAMATTSPGGDLILINGTRQALYLIGGSMALAAACGFPLLPPADDLGAAPARSDSRSG